MARSTVRWKNSQGGFTPQFFGDITDYSLVAGIRGELDNGFTYDFSARHGDNTIDYTLKNTVNPSMGPDSPTSFRPGDLTNTETQLQADFTYEFDVDLPSPLLLAFGTSYMDESYEVVEGGLNSYLDGPYAYSDPWGFCADGVATAEGLSVIANGSSLDCADSDDPVYQIVGVGSNGFPGYSPQFTGLYERESYALYADLSADVTDSLFLQAAARYENYDDFDPELVAKLAGRYSITDTLAIRGSVGTGFRAPTPGQQGTINVSTRISPEGAPIASGLFPPGGPVAAALGAVPLEPELSTNYTLGFTASFGDLDLTLDYYRIDMDDRMQAISTQPVSTDPASGAAYENYLALSGAGVLGAETIAGARYFTNAFDTRNQGVDLVATIPVDWGDAGVTSFQASINYNKAEYTSDVSDLFNAESLYDFENFDPNFRGVFTANHSIGDFTVIGRLNWFGPSTNSNSGGDPLRFQDIDEIYMFDTSKVSGRSMTCSAYRWAVEISSMNIHPAMPLATIAAAGLTRQELSFPGKAATTSPG